MNFVTKHRFCTLSGPGQVMTQFRVALFYWMTWPWPDDVIRPQWPSTIIVSERALNVAEIFFLCARRQAYSSGERLWINSDGKMETRHPVEGPFGSEFLMIFNDCGVMTAWSRKTWKFCEQFLRFLEKRPLMVQFSKFCSESFHCLTNWCCVEMSNNFSDGKSTKSCVIYRAKYFGSLSNCHCTDRAQKLPGSAPTFDSHCSKFQPNRFTFGGVIAERVKAVLLPNRVFSW